jgi:hypothetical protein
MDSKILLAFSIIFVVVIVLVGSNLTGFFAAEDKGIDKHSKIDIKVSEKTFLDCNYLESDPDFFLEITECSEDRISGYITFQEESEKTILTGWFNITDLSGGMDVSKLSEDISDLNCTQNSCSGMLSIDKEKKSRIPFEINLKKYNIPKENINLILQWGFGTSTVSVSQNSAYIIQSDDTSVLDSPWYNVSFQKSSCSTADPCGAESDLRIFDTQIPDADTSTMRNMYFGSAVRAMDYADSSLVESGPARVLVRFDNQTGNFRSSTTHVNWTEEVYAYPRYYQVYYIFSGNNTFSVGGSAILPFSIYETNATIANNPRFNEWNNRTINGTNYLRSTNVGGGADTHILGIVNQTMVFLYDDADHNKTFLYRVTTFNFTQNIRSYVYQTTAEIIWAGFNQSAAVAAGTYDIGYLMMFGRDGLTTVVNNETVYNSSFKEQYEAWHNPAEITAIGGTSEGRHNISGSYNYTANSTPIADFNFTTIEDNNYTYPTFMIKDISNIDNVKDYVYWKNYTDSSDWVQLNNYTDFVIQEGNSSYFGFNYVVILFNKTLGTESSGVETYKFWISNNTPPIYYPQWSQNDTSIPSDSQYTSGRNYGFSINWTDRDSSISSVWFATNFSGSMSNYTRNAAGTSNWTNFSNNTAGIWWINFTQEQFSGADSYVYKWFANDSSNLWNASDQWVYVINQAPVNVSLYLNGTEGNRTYLQDQVANFTAELNVSTNISLYSDYTGWVLQTNNTVIYNYTTLSTTGLNFNLTAYVNDSQNYSGPPRTYFFNVTPSNTPPTWSDNESSTPSEYNPNILSVFNITWTDDHDTNGYYFSWQEMNYSGMNNYTTTRLVGTNKSHYEVVLSAGTFYWKQYANDTANAWNSTPQFNFTINRNSSTQVSIAFSGNPVTYPTQTTTWCNITIGDQSATIALQRNGTPVASGSGNQSENILLGAAVYNYSCIYSQSQNYTSYSLLNQYLTVNQNNTYYMNLTINGTESNKQYTYPTGSNATSWYSIYNPPSDIRMWRNETQINNETALLGAGLYIYKINTSGNANYSSYSKNYNLTIQQGTPLITIGISPGNTTYPTQTNTTCTVNASQVTINLYRNNSLANSDNNTYIRLPAKTWNYTCNNTATQNYTSSFNSSILIISQNTSTSNYINLTINTTESNKNYVYPTGSNATAWHSLTALTSTAIMYKNSTPVTNETAQLGYGLYMYWWNITGDENYSSAYKQFNLSIDKGTPKVNLSVTPASPINYETQTNATCWGTSGLTFNLYRNGVLSNSENNTLITLGAGSYDYICNTTGNANYTSGSNSTSGYTVNTKSISIYLALNGTQADTTYIYPQAVNATGWKDSTLNSEGTLSLTRNGSSVSNPELIRLANSTYNYSLILSATNYTASSIINRYARVNKGNVSLFISVSPGNTTYPTQTTTQCTRTGGENEITINLYRNQSSANTENNTAIRLGANTYQYTCNYTTTQNYTTNTTSSILIISQNTSTNSFMNINLNNSESNQTFTYPAGSNITANYSSSVFSGETMTFNLYNNTSSVGSSNPISDVKQLAANVYQYVYNTSGNTNYSSASKKIILTINKTNNPVNLFLNGTLNNNKTYVYPQAVNSTGNSSTSQSDVTVKLYRNGTLVNSGTSRAEEDILLGNNTYEYKVNSTTGQNYSANDTGATFYAFVNKGDTESQLLINGSRANRAINQYRVLNFTVKTNVSGRSVELWTNYSDGVWKKWNGPQPEPLFNYTNMTVSGTFNFTANFSGDANYTFDLETWNVSVTEVDVVPPTWSNNNTNPSSPTTYSPSSNYQFNITWSDNIGVSDVVFEWNGVTNYTFLDAQISNYSNVYVRNMADLAVGSYTYRWFAVDGGDNWNQTSSNMYTINKANPISNMHIAVNGSETNQEFIYENATNTTGFSDLSNNQDMIFNLYRDGSQMSAGSPASNILLLGVGNYTYVYNTSGGTNYTSGSVSRLLNITKKSLPVFIALNGTVNSNRTYTYEEATNATGYKPNTINNEGSLTLLRNGLTVSGNQETVILGNNTYNYTVTVTATNYSNNQTTHFALVNKKTITLHVSLNGTEADRTYTYPEVINSTAWKDSTLFDEGSVVLLRNGSQVASGSIATELIRLGNSTYNYSSTFSATNYTASSIINRYARVNKGTPTIILTTSPGNSTYPTPTTTICYSNSFNNEAPAALHRNNSNVNSTENNLAIILGASTWNYTCNTTSTANYTTNSSFIILIINKSSTSMKLYLNDSEWISQSNSTYPNASKVNATVNVSTLQSSVVLRRNNTPVSNPEEILLGSNVYNYSGEFAGDENYTASSSQKILNITKGATDIRLFLNGTEGNRGYEQYETANFTAFINVTGLPITLQSNYSGFNPINNNTVIYNATNLSTLANFSNLTANFSGNENYTSSYKTYFFNVTPLAAKLVMNLVEPLEGSTKLLREGESFLMNASITCRVVDCGLVNATARYNSIVINQTGTVFTNDSVIQNCTLNVGQSCNVAWYVTATSLGSWNIDVNASNSISNNTADAILSVYRVITEIITLREIIGRLPSPLLDLEITNLTPIVVAGDNLYYTINLTNKGYNESSFDVIIHKIVLDNNNVKQLENAITKSMTTNLLLTDSMRIPRDLRQGRYFFELFVEYVGRNATAIAMFDVIESKQPQIDLSLLLIFAILAILAFVLFRSRELIKSILERTLEKAKKIQMPKPVIPKIPLPQFKAGKVIVEEEGLKVVIPKQAFKEEVIKRLKKKLKEGGFL